MEDLVAVPTRSKSVKAALAHAASNPTTGRDASCPSCDKSGLSILVALWAVVPPQNYPDSIRNNTNYVSHITTNAVFGSSYTKDRPLNKSIAGPSFECSQYVLRRLRKGFLHIHYPDENSWEIHEVQADGRLLRVNLNSPRPMGKGDAACRRFNSSTANFLLSIDAKKYSAFRIGFSDVFWTEAVRGRLAGDERLSAQFMQHIDCSNPGQSGGGLYSIGNPKIIEDTVLGFQTRPQTDTVAKEAYFRPPSVPVADVCESMRAQNRVFDESGVIECLLLPLEDDIGIATQLNHAKNAALADIMGENQSYTDADRQKMEAAALLDNVRQSSAEVWSRIEDNINLGPFESYLDKYVKCAEATANFSVFSADYSAWMQLIGSKPYPALFDPASIAACAKVSEVAVGIYSGCGQTKDEFNSVFLTALRDNPKDGNHLFWRGAAGNDQDLIDILLDPSIDKTLIDFQKKFDEVKGQLELLSQVKAAKAGAAAANALHWNRLASLLNARARRLNDADPKTFRRTMRRIQALTLHYDAIGIIDRTVDGDASGYLKQLKNAFLQNPEKIKITPRNAGQTQAISHLIVATWQPGKPVPPALQAAAVSFGIAADEMPPYTVTNVENPKDSMSGMRKVAGLNAGMGAVQAFSLFSSLQKLGVDLANASSGSPNYGRLTRDIGEATSSLLGLIAVTAELKAVSNQMRNAGSKSSYYYSMSLRAAKVSLAASAVEGGFQGYDALLLWERGDNFAAFFKSVAGASSVGSAGLGYVATRMIANQAVVGVAGEVAATAAAAATVARGGAVVTVEAPPVALWLSIASAGLFAVSVGADMYSKYLTTIPMEKWADRTFLGKNTAKWGQPFSTSKEQLESLLRELYAIKVSTPGYFDALLKFEIEVPVWGTESEIDFELKLDGRVIRRYVYKSGGTPIDNPTWQLHVKETDGSKEFAGTGTAKGQGALFLIEMGDQSLSTAIFNVLGMGTITPVSRAIAGIPSIAVRYSPNTAAHANFVIEGNGK